MTTWGAIWATHGLISIGLRYPEISYVYDQAYFAPNSTSQLLLHPLFALLYKLTPTLWFFPSIWTFLWSLVWGLLPLEGYSRLGWTVLQSPGTLVSLIMGQKLRRIAMEHDPVRRFLNACCHSLLLYVFIIAILFAGHVALVELAYGYASVSLFLARTSFEMLGSCCRCFDPCLKLVQQVEYGVRRLRTGIYYLTCLVLQLAAYMAVLTLLVADDIMNALQETEMYRLEAGLPKVTLQRHLPKVPLGMFFASFIIATYVLYRLLTSAFGQLENSVNSSRGNQKR